MLLKHIAVSLGLVATTLAQSPAWGQCGGQGWLGATTCVAGYACTYSNACKSSPTASRFQLTQAADYSQCIPGVLPSSAPPRPTTTVGTTTASNIPTSTSSGPAPTGSQIRTVQDPVFHFYLQNNDGVPMLGPEPSSGYFTIGSTIALNQSNGAKLFLNIDNSGTASYKSLTFGTTATTTNWGLEGDTIITTSPRQLNFIACPSSNANFYNIYLQQGNDTPAGKSCTLVTMHLPCLC